MNSVAGLALLIDPSNEIFSQEPRDFALCRSARPFVSENITATLNVNGMDITVDADTPLLLMVREHLGLTGTEFGCWVIANKQLPR